MGDGFLRCEYCGGTYSAEREWCPHCLAPRPEREVTVPEEQLYEPQYDVFYANNVMYIQTRIGHEASAAEDGSDDIERDVANEVDNGVMSTNEEKDAITSSCGCEHQKKSKPVAWVEGCGPYDSPYLLKDDSNYVIGATILGFLILLFLLMLGSGVLP